MTENYSPAKYFLCGGVGGACSVITGHPLDTIKVRLQTMPWPKPGEKPLYNGSWDCLLQTIHKEGFVGLYKGMTVPLTTLVPTFSLTFFSFGIGKQIFKEDPNQILNGSQIFLAGAFSGVSTTAIMGPGERIKCLLQIQRDKATIKYSGFIDCTRQLYAEGGLRSLYKGSFATLLRDVPATGTYFMTYEWIKQLILPERVNSRVHLLCTVLAGGCAGISFWVVALPADVLKSRLQTAPEGTYPQGLRSVFRELMEREGPTALYKAGIPVMCRTFPANAACFFGFEMTAKFLDHVELNI